MQGVCAFVGLDVHKETISIAGRRFGGVGLAYQQQPRPAGPPTRILIRDVRTVRIESDRSPRNSSPVAHRSATCHWRS